MNTTLKVSYMTEAVDQLLSALQIMNIHIGYLLELLFHLFITL
jgi:hypothetical protein